MRRVIGGSEAPHGTFALPVGWWEFSVRLFRYFEDRCSTEGITTRCAAPQPRSLSVTTALGTERNPVSSRRKNLFAAAALRRAGPGCPTRHRLAQPPPSVVHFSWILMNASSRCHLSPGRGQQRRTRSRRPAQTSDTAGWSLRRPRRRAPFHHLFDLAEAERNVGSDRGAVLVLRSVRFPGPPAAPGVRVSTHRALHVSFPLVSCGWWLSGSRGSGWCCRGSGSGSLRRWMRR
jgi:hypothetical protein